MAVRKFELLELGDEIMADTSFLIAKLLEHVGAKLIIAPFKHQRPFSTEETAMTQALARVCILIVRVITWVKKYYFWDSPVSLTAQ